MKRVVLLSDLHCGHLTGLTPEDEWPSVPSLFMVELWRWFERTAESLGAVDLVVVNGDAIDGKGHRSGGTELLTADRLQQVDMAYWCLTRFHAKAVRVVRGTPYHVGHEEDFEDVLASRFDQEAYDRLVFDAEGVSFDVRHKIGTSSIPHGRGTALARTMLWNELNAARGKEPLADVVVRAHAHYHAYVGDKRRLGMVLPGLQGPTKYGSKECEGDTDIGFVVFDVDNGGYTWKGYFMELVEARRPRLSL